jgi:uncharacterized protein with FMN-binding domain
MKRISLLVPTLLAMSTVLAFAADAAYKDGAYEGEYSFVKVRVVVSEGRVSDVDILQHGGGGRKYEDMVLPLCDRIVREQSTDADSVTGATVSSENLKKAVEDALRKAAAASP